MGMQTREGGRILAGGGDCSQGGTDAVRRGGEGVIRTMHISDVELTAYKGLARTQQCTAASLQAASTS